MSYLVLARKYRPSTFAEVVGQEHVTRTLGNAFASGRVHHAFLFCGPRGCGKTTLARIVGKALNCLERNGAEPCGHCTSCTSIANGSAVDYLEMDGASNRGIDAIRELTEAVRYQPAVLRKKVYVIDEVHMLTTEAFNALLKTLEEPPPHVTFVLATTEPHKLPNTILSRCQRYDFKLVPASRLAQHLSAIFGKESIAIETDAVSLVVRESGGSVRDALSLCDQIISYVGETTVTERHVAEVLGVADRSLTRSLVRALASGEAGAALGAVESALERGVDEVQLARAIVRYLRDLSVLQVAPDRLDLVDASDEERAELREEARQLDRSRTTQMFERMLRCCDELGKTLQPRLVLDCALIDVATVEPLVPLGDLIERLGELEARLSGRPAIAARPSGGKAAFKATTPGTGMPRPAGVPSAASTDKAAWKATTPGPAAPAAQAPASAPVASAPAASAPPAPPAPVPSAAPTPVTSAPPASAAPVSAPAVLATPAPAASATEASASPEDKTTFKKTTPGTGGPSRAPSKKRDAGADAAAMPMPPGDDIPHAAGASAAPAAVPVPVASSASAPTSMQPSGPVPKAPAVASGSGPHDPAIAIPSSPAEALTAWNDVLGQLETRRKFSLLGPFQHARVLVWTADEIQLGFPFEVHSMGEMASERSVVDELRGIIRELGPELRNIKLSVKLLDEAESQNTAARSVLETTRERTTQERGKRELEAREHPITKHVLQTFGAQIKEIKTDV